MSNNVTTESYVEPWLSGSHGDVPAAGRAVLHALELAHDDIRKWTEGLTDAEIHSAPFGLMSIAVQLRHIRGSIDRILTYAEGKQLTDGQLAQLKAESSGVGNGTRAEFLIALQATFASAASRIRALAVADLETQRTVGRKQLPTSVGGALIHVADHTQRHTGQVVTTAKLLRAMRQGQTGEEKAPKTQ